MRWIDGGAHRNEDKHVEHVARRVMPQLEPKQSCFRANREVEVEVTVQLVVDCSALTDARQPVF